MLTYAEGGAGESILTKEKDLYNWPNCLVICLRREKLFLQTSRLLWIAFLCEYEWLNTQCADVYLKVNLRVYTYKWNK
jgi:hypothetical protein